MVGLKKDRGYLMATDQFSVHEAMDRAHVAADYFEEHVRGHVFVMNDPEMLDLSTSILKDMHALYQTAAGRAFCDEGEANLEESSEDASGYPISAGLGEEQYKKLLGLVKKARSKGHAVAFADSGAMATRIVKSGKAKPDEIIMTNKTSYEEACAYLLSLVSTSAEKERAQRLLGI